MNKEELHNHIKNVAEYYISESWGSFLDLDETDLIMAGIGVGKIIAGEQEKRIEELEEENAELKKTLRTYGCGDWDNDFHTCRVYLQHEELQMYIEQLTKATDIIKKFSEFVNNEVEYDPEHPQEHTVLWNELCKEAEQFINSEVEE